MSRITEVSSCLTSQFNNTEEITDNPVPSNTENLMIYADAGVDFCKLN